jgi:hypothetical protein
MGIEEKADIVKFTRMSESEEDVRRETVGCVSTVVSSSVAVSAVLWCSRGRQWTMRVYTN